MNGITETALNDLLSKARKRLTRMSRIERDDSFASPEECPLITHFRTASEAVKCGIRIQDWPTVAEGLVMLNDAIDRMEE